MISEPLPGIFRIAVPLPASPLRSLNAWLVAGGERSLLIDNGFNAGQCEQALRDSLASLGVDIAKLDLFLTHCHSDHCGLSAKIKGIDSRVYCSQIDGGHINALIANPGLWEELFGDLAFHGFPIRDLSRLAETHPGRLNACDSALDFVPVREGDILAYGEYRFVVRECPGHTPGQLALHEENEKFLISGDHILGQISPNISLWREAADSLGDYLRSLARIASLGSLKGLPGHGQIVDDTRARAGALCGHHQERLAEALGVLAQASRLNAWDAAAEMRWNAGGAWNDWPAAQKCFALAEAAAHLDHLAAIGKAARLTDRAGYISYEASGAGR